MKKRLLAVGVFLLCFVIFTAYTASAQEAAATDDAASVPEALVTGSGALQKAIFLSETENVGNGSDNDWKNAFNKDVTLGGTSAQCIEMRYSGEVKDETPAFADLRIEFRATVDGDLAQGGARFFDVPTPYTYTTAAMNWWACGLTPGVHTVRIQFRPHFDVDKAVVRKRTLIIEYKQ